MMRRLLTVALLLAGSSAWAQNDFIRYSGSSLTLTTGGSAFFSSGISLGNVVTSPYANLYGDAANTLALRNSTNAQTFNLYNTYTDGSNYERANFFWSSNVFYITTSGTGTGSGRNMQIGAGSSYVLVDSILAAKTADTYTIGYASGTNTWQSLFLTRSIQGSKSKTLTDNTATAFVRLTIADDDYEGCDLIYTAYAEDADTDARQVRHGRHQIAMLNNSGTEACNVSTGDSGILVTAGTFTCTIDCAAGTNTVDLRATCDTSLDAAAETLTFEYRLDCPSIIATLTPQ